MDLREYLFRNRMTVKYLSECLDCTRCHLSSVVNGKIKPGKRLARDIEAFTNGEVTAESLLKNSEEKEED